MRFLTFCERASTLERVTLQCICTSATLIVSILVGRVYWISSGRSLCSHISLLQKMSQGFFLNVLLFDVFLVHVKPSSSGF